MKAFNCEWIKALLLATLETTELSTNKSINVSNIWNHLIEYKQKHSC